MKKWIWAVAVSLAAALFFVIYLLAAPAGSAQQLKLWYVSGDFSPAALEQLAKRYNSQREDEHYELVLQAFETEDELAAAFEQSRPDLLLCSYDRAASLGSREHLAELANADWDYLPAIEDALPFAGRSFYPLGSAIPLLACNDALPEAAGIAPELSSFEALCATAEKYSEKTGSPFFTAEDAAPPLAVWSASLGYELHGDMERDGLNKNFRDLYNRLAGCTAIGGFLPPADNAAELFEAGLIPCAIISSTRAARLAEGRTLLPLPLPEGGREVYTPEIMGLAVTGANSYSLPSARAFVLWLRDNFSAFDAFSLGLVPITAEADCQPELPLSLLLLDSYENFMPLVFSPLGSYMENRQEMERQLCRALDLLY